jgi:D-serine deaminase-like pyridoxal phosphate-dependent protein
MLSPLSLSEPVLLLDPTRARRNIHRMAERARHAGVRLRPHFKTHQSQGVGRWFREAGVEAITVSSLAMAEYFAADGWNDITLAFPFHPGMRQRVEALAQRVHLAITIADPLALDGVEFGARLDAWLKIDVGSRRTGFDPADGDTLSRAASTIAAHRYLTLRGLLAHAGHSYAARDAAAIDHAHVSSLALMRQLRESLRLACGALELSVGDTPTCSRAETFPGVDEIRPGNFVFYDLSQWQIGACAIDDIAVAMACPVAARHPERGRLVIHGGAVHFSKDWMELDDERLYGLGVEACGDGWADLRTDVRLVSLSQEHGLVAAPAELIARTRPGDTLLMLPVHSCLTADVMGRYRCIDGEVIDTQRRG